VRTLPLAARRFLLVAAVAAGCCLGPRAAEAVVPDLADRDYTVKGQIEIDPSDTATVESRHGVRIFGSILEPDERIPAELADPQAVQQAVFGPGGALAWGGFARSYGLYGYYYRPYSFYYRPYAYPYSYFGYGFRSPYSWPYRYSFSYYRPYWSYYRPYTSFYGSWYGLGYGGYGTTFSVGTFGFGPPRGYGFYRGPVALPRYGGCYYW